MRHSRLPSRLLAMAILTAISGSTASSQVLKKVPPLALDLGGGAELTATRGPTIAVTVLKAADGSGKTRLRIDPLTPGCNVTAERTTGGTRYKFACSFDIQALGKFDLEAELDLLDLQADGSYNLLARVTKVPPALAVSSLGIEVEMPDFRGTQTLFVPVFSGAEFVEPATTIPADRPLDTGVSHSVQVTAYYTSSGTGFMMMTRDPEGTKPKHYLASSGKDRFGRDAVRFGFDFYMPNTHVGGRPAATPVLTSVVPCSFDPATTTGWFVVAKRYRKWLEDNASKPGMILEQGLLEGREDVPKWAKEIDLFNHERFGWFPQDSKVKDPLFTLRKYKTVIGAENVLTGIWFWNDRCNDLGRQGSWLPLPETSSQFRTLLAEGFRFAGYTFPWMDVKNPVFRLLGFDQHALQKRNGDPETMFVLGKELQTLWMLDPASRHTQDWYEVLGNYHARFSGLSALYTDFPATVGFEDFRRPSGDLGITEASYKGYIQLMRRAQKGGRDAGRDMAGYHESAYEWLIRCTPTGEGATGVIGRAYQKDTNTRGVPFFQAVYSGYTQFWPADELLGPAMVTLVPDAYGDADQSNMSRLLCEGFTWGNILNTSDYALADGKIFWEAPRGEKLRRSFEHHRDVLKELVALRRMARPWMVYGEMLNSPVARGDEIDMTIRIPFGLSISTETFRKLVVPASAWRAKDGTIRLVAANGGRTKAGVTVNLSRIGLGSAWKLVDVRTKEEFAPDARGDILLNVDGGRGRMLEPVQR